MKIRQKLLIAFLVATTVPIILIGTFNFYNSRNALRESVSSGMNVIAEFKEGQVFFYLETIKTRAIDFASDGYIRDNLEKIVESNSVSTTEALKAHLIKNKKILDPSIIHIDLVDMDGDILVTTGGERSVHDVYEEGYFEDVLNKTVIKDVELISSSAFIGAEIIINAMVRGYPIGEAGIKTYPRTFGESSVMSIRHITNSIRDMFRVYNKIFKQK